MKNLKPKLLFLIYGLFNPFLFILAFPITGIIDIFIYEFSKRVLNYDDFHIFVIEVGTNTNRISVLLILVILVFYYKWLRFMQKDKKEDFLLFVNRYFAGRPKKISNLIYLLLGGYSTILLIGGIEGNAAIVIFPAYIFGPWFQLYSFLKNKKRLTGA